MLGAFKELNIKNILRIIGLLLLLGCKQEEMRAGGRVDIYLLKSFSVGSDMQTAPPTVLISQAVLEEVPLIGDEDISGYNQKTHTYYLRKDVRTQLKSLDANDGFAVTVNHVPVYLGKVHPNYMSSLILGVATIDPIIFTTADALSIQYVFMEGSTDIKNLDKRNAQQLLEVFRASGRLR